MMKKLYAASMGMLVVGMLFAEERSVNVRAELRSCDRVFYVSAESRQRAEGSREYPFATLDAARDAVRAARKDAPALRYGICVLRGRYALQQGFALDQADNGTAQSPLRVVAEPGTILCGSIPVPGAALTSMPGGIYRFNYASLTGRKLSKPGANFRMPFHVPELFCKGERLHLAQWPNEGWATIETIINQGTMLNDGSVSDSSDPNKKRPTERIGGIFQYSGDVPSRWDVKKGVWLHGYWCFDWFDDVGRVESIDVVKKQIKFERPHQYGLRQGNPSPRRWRAINVKEELDLPGEYYVDAEAGDIYLILPPGATTHDVRVSVGENSLIQLQQVQHVQIKGFILEENNVDALTIRDSSFVTIENCTIRNIRKIGVYMQGGEKNRLVGCDVHDTGTGGITLMGGDRKTLTPGGHVVENCHIWRFASHQLTYANGLMIGGVGNIARHNFLHDAPHQAVGVSGNDHLFEYNMVSNVLTAADDAGALYKGRDPSCRGNMIRYNYWTHIGSPRGHGNAAIYFDDGDGGDFVIGNIFFQCGEPGKGSFATVFSHGGHDNVVKNNIFVGCKRALGSAPWSDKRWKDFILAPLWLERLLKAVDITKPPYTTHYPELVGFMNPQPDAPRDNHSSGNLFFRCGELKSGRWTIDQSDFVTNEDPGFRDLEAKDFRLKKQSVVFLYNPDFQQIPVEEIGLQRK